MLWRRFSFLVNTVGEAPSLGSSSFCSDRRSFIVVYTSTIGNSTKSQLMKIARRSLDYFSLFGIYVSTDEKRREREKNRHCLLCQPFPFVSFFLLRSSSVLHTSYRRPCRCDVVLAKQQQRIEAKVGVVRKIIRSLYLGENRLRDRNVTRIEQHRERLRPVHDDA